MEQPDQGPLTPHRVIADQVKTLRKGRGWSAERLGAEMSRVGIPWTRVVVTKLETGRRPAVTVGEWLALSHVLGVAPVDLLAPANVDDATPYQVLPDGEPVDLGTVKRYLGATPETVAQAIRVAARLADRDGLRLVAVAVDGTGWSLEKTKRPATEPDDGDR